MNIELLKSTAIDKTIRIFSEVGIKFRKGEFTDEKVAVIQNPETGITNIRCFFYFDNSDRSKNIQRVKNKLLNYFHVTIFKFGVLFDYPIRELELEAIKDQPDSDISIEKIMEKIDKLLALSESDNEHEAIAASMKAQELLKKYNIEIEAVTGKTKDDEIDSCVAIVGTGRKWKYNLAEVIAKSYCCKCYYLGNERICFYGHKSDALIARRVFVYLFEVGNRLAKSYEKNERDQYGYAIGIYNSFCLGFTDGIESLLSKQCTSLMLVVPEEVSESFSELTKESNTINTNINSIDSFAYSEGLIEGKRALNGQFIGN